MPVTTALDSAPCAGDTGSGLRNKLTKTKPLTPEHMATGHRRAPAGPEAALRKAGARSRRASQQPSRAPARQEPSALSAERWALPGREEGQSPSALPRNGTQRRLKRGGPGRVVTEASVSSKIWETVFLIKKCYTGRLEAGYNNLTNGNCLIQLKRLYRQT